VIDSDADTVNAVPPGAMWDIRKSSAAWNNGKYILTFVDHYQTPQFFKDNFNYFDNWQEVTGYEDVTLCTIPLIPLT
jgi:alpha-L-arabinofuranosidase